MKKIFTTITLLLVSTFIFGQGTFAFENEKHDFGNVKEGDLATYVFTFKNVGNAPIVLSKVKASCGCTTPQWSKKPILPGETSSIKAVYNSKNRPGKFYKTITITSNASEATKRLTIAGMVERDPNKVANSSLSSSLKGTLQLIDNEYNFGKIQKGEILTHKFKYQNTGKNPLVIYAVQSPCKCVKLKGVTQTLKPGATGFLELEYKPLTKNDKPENVILISNSTAAKSIITLKGKVVESLMFHSLMKE